MIEIAQEIAEETPKTPSMTEQDRGGFYVRKMMNQAEINYLENSIDSNSIDAFTKIWYDES